MPQNYLLTPTANPKIVQQYQNFIQLFYNFVKFEPHISHMRYKTLILITISIISQITAFSATRDIMVKHLNTDQGLSHYTVNSIWQDEFGFIWIGTMDGLNRFDGHRIKVYKPDASDTTSLRENNIRQICGDMAGHLYIKGLNSVSEFDMRTSSFRMLKDNGVRHIFHDGTSLWVAGPQTLSTYDGSRFSTRFSFSDIDVRNAAIDCFIITRNGDQCICTNKHGFYRINSSGHLVQHLEVGPVNSLYEDSGGNIWLATRNEGIYVLRNDGGIRHHVHDSSDQGSLAHNTVRQICEDHNGNFWISTYDGLCRLRNGSDEFIHYRYEFEHHAFNIRSIISMICDRQGTLWFGSFYEGVSSYSTEAESYVYYKPEKDVDGSLYSPVTSSISEDSEGTLWIGTEGGGIGIKTEGMQDFKALTEKDGLASDVIKSTLYDSSDNSLYISYLHQGLDKYDINSGKITHYGAEVENSRNTIIENIISMKHYGRDSLILATNYGILVFDKNTGKMSILETGFTKNYRAQVWDMEIDGDNLWFTTSTNLYCYNQKNKSTKFYSFQDISSSHINNNLNSILKDSKGRLWFGSSGSGVFLYNAEGDSFTNIVTAEDMGNGYVTGLDEDPLSGNIYIATNNGLTRYDPEAGTLRTFNSGNGFPLSGINENSLFITSGGELFASDMNGLVSVRCDSLDSAPRKYNVYISGLLINNEYVSPLSDGKGDDILFRKKVVLRPGDSAIGFEISNTDYMNNSSGLQVEYRMEGFDHDFIRATGTDHITYTNLNPGNYTFVVRGLFPDSDGNLPSTMVSIKVIPPFYRTIWFMMLCLCLMISIAVYLVKAYTTSIRLRSLLDSEKREKEYIRQVNQDKLRFFTNISHEFRTPLTLIDGQLELILQRNDLKPSIYTKLVSVYRNSQRLRRLVDEIIDIRKQEAGKLKLKISENDIVSFLREMYVSFEEYAKRKKISFNLELPNPPVLLKFDPVQMEKVFFNLLSNAFKFTREGGTISMEAEDSGDSFIIRVIDNGAGISPESISHIFERFFQDDKLNAKLSYYGSGVGLSLTKTIIDMHGGEISAESVPGERTCFTVKLSKKPVFKGETVMIDDADDTSAKHIAEYSKDFRPEEMVAADEKDKSVHILIVEDNDDVRDMLQQIFSPIYSVTTAVNGEEGIELAKKENPDIILSDVMMPGISGFEMCSKLKNNIETCHIPIVLLTAKTAENQIIEGLQTGADDYVTKPFNVKLLVARCNNLVAGRRRLQQKYLKQPEASVSMLTSNPKEQALLEKAVDIVTRHIDSTDFNIEAFAKEMGLSRTYLFTKIKGLTGQSPNEFISSIRLKQAAVRLKENPDASMVDIAYSLGFSSPSYFIKCFKEMYGKTPNSFRKEMAGK